VYSHDADVRAQVRLAIGRRPAMDVPEAEIIEVATQPALFRLLDAGGADVMVLDGEAQPYGGMGGMPPGQGRDLQLPAGAADHRPGRRWLAGHPGRGPTPWSATRSTRSRWPTNWPG